MRFCSRLDLSGNRFRGYQETVLDRREKLQLGLTLAWVCIERDGYEQWITYRNTVQTILINAKDASDGRPEFSEIGSLQLAYPQFVHHWIVTQPSLVTVLVVPVRYMYPYIFTRSARA
jgi:hypothetical protein